MSKTDLYEQALLNPNVPFDKLREVDPLPEYLYKYIKFDKNSYWKDYVRGDFHLSYPIDFTEDPYDCKINLAMKSVLSELEVIKSQYGISKANDNIAILQELADLYSNDQESVIIKLFEQYTNNYRSIVQETFKKTFRIGCFTKSFNDEDMWKNYASNGGGILLKYHTMGNKLLESFMHKVIYKKDYFEYDVSPAIAILLALDGSPDNAYMELRKKADRVTWTCSYIKNTRWDCEKEYRLTIPPYIMTAEREIAGTGYIVNEKGNISLLDSIEAIYLRRVVEETFEYRANINTLRELAKENNIPIYILD